MFDYWKENIEGILILGTGIVVFNYIIQPVLVSIDRMFIDQYVPPGETTRLVPATPDEWATLGTILIPTLIYFMVIRPHFLEKEEEE